MDLNRQLLDYSYEGLTDKVRFLIENKANTHVWNDEPLRNASEFGHLEIAKLLLEAKANIHAQDDIAIRGASDKGHLDIVKLLIEYDANIHEYEDEALRYSSANGYTAIAKVLLDAKANIHIRDDQTLYYTSWNYHTSTVKLLLEYKANINNLHEEFIKKYMTIHEDNISYLLELDQVCNLSEVKQFQYLEFMKIKSDIQSNIDGLLGKNVGNIAFSYI